jgi:hypothetical protein
VRALPGRLAWRLALVAVLLWTPLLWWGAGSSGRYGCAPPQLDAWDLLGYVVGGGVLANPEVQPPGANPQQNVAIVIDAVARRLYVLVDGRLERTFPVAVGTPETPSPIGHWTIVKKAVWGGAFGARWMQLSIPWGTYGIHGTNNPGSIGYRASHGCIRMYNRDVIQLYDMVSVGTPVTIRGQPFYRFGEVRRVIVPSHLGSDVIQLQEKLRDLGLYAGPVDGVYGSAAVAAVRRFQEQHGLKPTGVVDAKTYDLLGIRPAAEDPDLRPGPPPGSG